MKQNYSNLSFKCKSYRRKSYGPDLRGPDEDEQSYFR